MTQTAAEIATAVRSGALTARSATQHALQRIEQRDGPLGAFQRVRAVASLHEAEATSKDTRSATPAPAARLRALSTEAWW